MFLTMTVRAERDAFGDLFEYPFSREAISPRATDTELFVTRIEMMEINTGRMILTATDAGITFFQI